jgi:predicted HicB family RNase H-like nuclease
VITLPDRLNIYVGTDIHKKIKMLAVEQDTNINALVVEAIEDLLRKYEANKK